MRLLSTTGRKPTFLSSFVQKLSRKLSTALPEIPAATKEEEETPNLSLYIAAPSIELQTSLPAKLDIGKDSFEQFLAESVLLP